MRLFVLIGDLLEAEGEAGEAAEIFVTLTGLGQEGDMVALINGRGVRGASASSSASNNDSNSDSDSLSNRCNREW